MRSRRIAPLQDGPKSHFRGSSEVSDGANVTSKSHAVALAALGLDFQEPNCYEKVVGACEPSLVTNPGSGSAAYDRSQLSSAHPPLPKPTHNLKRP